MGRGQGSGAGALKRIGLVTCRQLPEPDHDEELLLGALRSTGLEAELLAWDYEGAKPSDFDLCVLRSCWNYFRDPSAFLAFVDRVEHRSRLMNPSAVVRWNLHKGYLLELERAGVPIVPTVFLERGRTAALERLLDEREWREVVIKPAISAASFRTRRFARSSLAEGQAFLDLLLSERDAMLQPYMDGVDNPGERALVWIDGELTHAIRKRARFDDQLEEVSDALDITPADRHLAERALASVDADLLYARVDVVPERSGALVLSELELIEPSLFLKQKKEALDRLVSAIVRMSGG